MEGMNSAVSAIFMPPAPSHTIAHCFSQSHPPTVRSHYDTDKDIRNLGEPVRRVSSRRQSDTYLFVVVLLFFLFLFTDVWTCTANVCDSWGWPEIFSPILLARMGWKCTETKSEIVGTRHWHVTLCYILAEVASKGIDSSVGRYSGQSKSTNSTPLHK